MVVPGEHMAPPATDAAVIEQSWAEPERFEAIFRRYFGKPLGSAFLYDPKKKKE